MYYSIIPHNLKTMSQVNKNGFSNVIEKTAFKYYIIVTYIMLALSLSSTN